MSGLTEYEKREFKAGFELLDKDKDGVCRGKTEWNEDKTELITNSYRTKDPKRTYKSVRALATTSDKKMIITTTNHLGKTLIQNYELDETQGK